MRAESAPITKGSAAGNGSRPFCDREINPDPVDGGKVDTAQHRIGQQGNQHGAEIEPIGRDLPGITGSADYHIQPDGVVGVGQQSHKAVLHNVQDHKGRDAHQRKMLLELMPDHAGGIQAQDGADQRGQPLDGREQQHKAADIQNVLQNICQLPEVAHGTGPVREDAVDVQHPAQEEYTEGKRDDQDAAQQPHHAGDELGQDELRRGDRQGVHQITLAPQQVAGEPLDDGECGDDCDGDTQHQVNGRDDDDGKIRSQRWKAEERPQQCSSSQNGQIQSAVNAAGGLELIL